MHTRYFSVFSITLRREDRVLYGQRARPRVLHTLFMTDNPTSSDLAASCKQPLSLRQFLKHRVQTMTAGLVMQQSHIHTIGCSLHACIHFVQVRNSWQHVLSPYSCQADDERGFLCVSSKSVLVLMGLGFTFTLPKPFHANSTKCMGTIQRFSIASMARN